VLHHAQDARLVLDKVRRVLRVDGLAIVYEDNPGHWWDRFVCWGHNKQWQHRTGPCTFRLRAGWREVFDTAGFEIVSERELSRWRNIAHPVSRSFFVIKPSQSTAHPQFETVARTGSFGASLGRPAIARNAT